MFVENPFPVTSPNNDKNDFHLSSLLFLHGRGKPRGRVVGTEIAQIGEESLGRAEMRGPDEQIPFRVGLLHFVTSAHFGEGKTANDEDHKTRDAALRSRVALTAAVPLTITHGSRRRRVVA